MKNSLLPILLVCTVALQNGFAQSQVVATDSITVDQAVRRALETHPALAQGRAAVLVSQSKVSQAELPLKPEVTAEAGYVRLDPVSEFVFPGLGAMPVFTSNNYDAHIGVRSTLYDFGKTEASVDVNRSRVKTSIDALELTKTTLAVQTQRIFYAMLLLQKSIPVLDEQLAALNEHLRVIQKRVSAGTATNFDVLTTQVRIASVQNQRVDLVNTLARQESEFRLLVGWPTGVPVHVTGDFAQHASAFSSRLTTDDSLVVSALNQRLESVIARDAEETARLQRKNAEFGSVPMLKAAVTYGFKNGFEPNFDVLRGNWSASVKIEVPVYDAGRTRLQEEEAEAAMIAEGAHRNDIERQILSDVEQAGADVQAADEKVKISEIQLTQAHDAVTIARTRYETGTVTNLDLLDAETAETVARHTRLQALYKYVISLVELDRARGKRY